MPWLKVSDTAGMHPMVLAPLTDELADDGLDPFDRTNVLAGMVYRCATMSANYLTDYVVSDAVVFQVAGPNWRKRAEAAERAGYWKRVDAGWLIVEDPTFFVHIRKAAEVAWDRQRRKDIATPALTVPVRLRDGDACRYCGLVVVWSDQRGNRGGTYDHRIPGQAAQSPDDLFVACRSCNGRRGDNPDSLARLPAPAEPLYGDGTVEFLAKHGHVVPIAAPARPGTRPAPAPTRPGNQPDTATTARPRPRRDTAPSATPQPAGPREPRPGIRPDNAPTAATPSTKRAPPSSPAQERRHGSADSVNRRAAGSGFPGRVGTGSGSGFGVGREPAAGGVRRARRGRRSRSRNPPPGSTTTDQPSKE